MHPFMKEYYDSLEPTAPIKEATLDSAERFIIGSKMQGQMRALRIMVEELYRIEYSQDMVKATITVADAITAEATELATQLRKLL